jgi:hypothetical protein
MASVRFILGLIVILGIIISKYFQTPEVFLIIMVCASLLYLRYFSSKEIIRFNFEDKLIGLAQFIILIGILGFITVKIMGVFLVEFN